MLRGYMFDLIAMVAPHLTRKAVEKALSAPAPSKQAPNTRRRAPGRGKA